MEAHKFGFGMPPEFKFDPTDADIVAYYLLPRALGLDNPYEHAITKGDPSSAPPWEILQRNGHADIDHAFFLGGRRRRRGVPGGVWVASNTREDTVTLLRSEGGEEVDIRYRRCNFAFHSDQHGSNTGYLMDEYEILKPPLPDTVLTRIRIAKSFKNGKRPLVPPAAAAAEQQVADPEQPRPSYEQDAAAKKSNGEGFTGAQHGALNGRGMVENAGDYYTAALQYVLPEAEYDSNYRVSIPDQPGASYSYNAAAMKSDGEGFTYGYGQADAFYGGRMVETAAPYYDPSNYVSGCGGNYSNYYGEYQARYAPVMLAGGEGFGSEQ